MPDTPAFLVFPRYYAITAADGTILQTFAHAEHADYRLDGDTWTELPGSPVARWLRDLRVDLDLIDPPAGVAPPPARELAADAH